MGGAKGGSDFNPRGKSDEEVMKFCQSFMTELQRHVGKDTDVPAGDIGVGGREIGYLFGQYKRIRDEFGGVLTGKGLAWGGSPLRPEATGYGLCYFTEAMLATRGTSFEGKTVAVSGAGNVAQYAVEKAIALGAKVVTMSDSDGFIYDADGIDAEKLAYVKELKNVYRGRIREYVQNYPTATYTAGQRPWSVPCDIALPCATQNEISREEAQTLVANGCICVAEGANRPALCPRKGVQRRRRGYIRIGNDPELHASALDPRRSGCPAAPYHGRYPCGLPPVRYARGRYGGLCKRRQRSRLHQGGRCHDGARFGLKCHWEGNSNPDYF